MAPASSSFSVLRVLYPCLLLLRSSSCLQTISKCWCSASVDLRHGDGTCDFACIGDFSTTCDGFDAFDLFELEASGSVSPPLEDYYLGCFADDQQDRVLEDKMSSGEMSLQVHGPNGACSSGVPCSSVADR